MDILLVIVILLAVLLVSVWSCARSYFEKGRLQGMKQAAREFTRGAQFHCATDKTKPDRIAASTEALRALVDSNDRAAYDPLLWAVGEAVGEACWRRGNEAGIHEGTVPAGRIRIDLPLGELLQISWLAHLGFLHMMPNYRGFEIHRFSGPEDAREGARSVAVLECALPVAERPFGDVRRQIQGREDLIAGWWAASVRQSA